MNIPKSSLLNIDKLDYNYIDTYEYTITDRDDSINIIQIAELFIQPGPKWIQGLFTLRNRIVSFSGIKSSVPADNGLRLWDIGAQAGIFRVFDVAANEIILGENDKHLDFRVSLLLEPHGQYKKVIVTTVVKFHNKLGRCYFFFIKPIHRILVPQSLKRMLKPFSGNKII